MSETVSNPSTVAIEARELYPILEIIVSKRDAFDARIREEIRTELKEISAARLLKLEESINSGFFFLRGLKRWLYSDDVARTPKNDDIDDVLQHSWSFIQWRIDPSYHNSGWYNFCSPAIKEKLDRAVRGEKWVEKTRELFTVVKNVESDTTVLHVATDLMSVIYNKFHQINKEVS